MTQFALQNWFATAVKLKYINKKQIKCVESTKYLGLTLDYKLNWEEHIENNINSAIQKQKNANTENQINTWS